METIPAKLEHGGRKDSYRERKDKKDLLAVATMLKNTLTFFVVLFCLWEMNALTIFGTSLTSATSTMIFIKFWVYVELKCGIFC